MCVFCSIWWRRAGCQVEIRGTWVEYCWYFRIQQDFQSCLASVPCGCLRCSWCLCAHPQYQHRKIRLAQFRRVRGLAARFHGMLWAVVLDGFGMWGHFGTTWMGGLSLYRLQVPEFRKFQWISGIIYGSSMIQLLYTIRTINHLKLSRIDVNSILFLSVPVGITSNQRFQFCTPKNPIYLKLYFVGPDFVALYTFIILYIPL